MENAGGCGCLGVLLTLAIAGWLFVPRYDLEVATGRGPSQYEIVERGFWTLGSCRKAAEKYPARDWSALKWTQWGRLVTYKYSDWAERVR